MSLIKSKLIQNITEANPHLFVRDVERSRGLGDVYKRQKLQSVKLWRSTDQRIVEPA